MRGKKYLLVEEAAKQSGLERRRRDRERERERDSSQVDSNIASKPKKKLFRLSRSQSGNLVSFASLLYN